MARIVISPQGYVYGDDPTADNPFWDTDTPGTREYIKDITGSAEETTDGKTYTITKEDGAGVITNVLSIFVPNATEIPDAVAGLRITETPVSNGTRYYFTIIMTDESETGVGNILVPNGTTVEVTGEEVGGVNTITITVDGVASSFDVPTQYLKTITSNGGVSRETYTITDESGTTVTWGEPRYYVETLTRSVDTTTKTVTDEADVVQNGVETSGVLGYATLSDDGAGNYGITLGEGDPANGGDSVSIAWSGATAHTLKKTTGSLFYPLHSVNIPLSAVYGNVIVDVDGDSVELVPPARATISSGGYSAVELSKTVYSSYNYYVCNLSPLTATTSFPTAASTLPSGVTIGTYWRILAGWWCYAQTWTTSTDGTISARFYVKPAGDMGIVAGYLTKNSVNYPVFIPVYIDTVTTAPNYTVTGLELV